MNKTISVVVSTYNPGKYLQGFLDSFYKHTNYDNYILTIYSDDPKNKVADCVQLPDDKRLCVIEDGKNVFWGERRNRMAWEASEQQGHYVVFFDDDMRIVTDNWLSYVVRIMDAFQDVGILGLHWARLKDGKTRQAHHAPTRLITQGDLTIQEKKFVPGNSWVCRPEALEQTGSFITAATREEWKAQSPGADTEYHNRMLHQTDFILAATETDLVWHAGLDEMK